MQLITIIPKIYNRTRPTHQSNTEHDASTPNTTSNTLGKYDSEI